MVPVAAAPSRVPPLPPPKALPAALRTLALPTLPTLALLVQLLAAAPQAHAAPQAQHCPPGYYSHRVLAGGAFAKNTAASLTVRANIRRLRESVAK